MQAGLIPHRDGEGQALLSWLANASAGPLCCPRPLMSPFNSTPVLACLLTFEYFRLITHPLNHAEPPFLPAHHVPLYAPPCQRTPLKPKAEVETKAWLTKQRHVG